MYFCFIIVPIDQAKDARAIKVAQTLLYKQQGTQQVQTVSATEQQSSFDPLQITLLNLDTIDKFVYEINFTYFCLIDWFFFSFEIDDTISICD
jgi:hypothetical protein